MPINSGDMSGLDRWDNRDCLGLEDNFGFGSEGSLDWARGTVSHNWPRCCRSSIGCRSRHRANKKLEIDRQAALRKVLRSLQAATHMVALHIQQVALHIKQAATQIQQVVLDIRQAATHIQVVATHSRLVVLHTRNKTVDQPMFLHRKSPNPLS